LSVRDLNIRPGVLLAVGIGAAALLAALVVVVVGWQLGGDGSTAPGAEPLPEIEAGVVVAPREVLFGDTVHARFEIVLDKGRVDPDSVRVAADFSPWEIVGRSAPRRQDDGDVAYLRTTFVLRCVTGTCLPSGQSARYDFRPARIAFGAPSDQRIEESSIELPLPPIRVYSRFAAANRDADPFSSPWRADVLSLPSVSYRFSPGVLLVILLGGAALAAIAGLTLAYVAWPRRAPAPPPEPPPPAPVPVLSPLEQALVLLEHSIRGNGAAAQRRALEQVAEQLELADWGDASLARKARVLAWSEGVPPVEETTSLAARVRSVLPEVEEPEENGGVRVE
jgi:hypothetical protein